MLIIGALLAGAATAAEVKLEQAADRTVTVRTPVYLATVDAQGNFALRVKDAPALEQKFVPDAEAVLSIQVTNQMVAVRAGKARVEYTFSEDAIAVVTEGFGFGFAPAVSVKAVLVPGGKGGPFGVTYYANSSGLVLENGLCVTYAFPFHVGPKADLRLIPSAYCNGSKKGGDLLELTLKLGQPAEAAQMLSGVSLEAAGINRAPLLLDGNQGGYIPHFAESTAIACSTRQQNLSAQEFSLSHRLTVLDHYVAGKQVYQRTQPLTLAASGKGELAWSIPHLPPGFYYATVEVLDGDRALTSEKLTFAVNLPAYTHPLTRPADFADFWKGKVAALRALPFAATLSEVKEKSTDAAVYYDLELTIADGKRLKTVLQVPRQPGKYIGKFGGGPQATDGTAVLLAMPIQEVEMMTFNRWVDRDNNNYLDSYLFTLRLTDYLRSRPEVGQIYLFGASRTGPVQFVNAALDSTRIAALDIHVPTSAGLSWTDTPYAGWGMPQGCKPAVPESVQKFAPDLAYFDPVNFAPDVKVPWITAYGLDDDLSRPQGIEAMFKQSPAQWKHISRDPGGHQYSQGFQRLQKELAQYLQAAVQAGTDDKIMKEH